MSTVHLVVGSTGEYSDQHTWTVAAFTSPRRAETFCRRANDWMKAHGYAGGRSYPISRNVGSPYDPECQVDYTGTEYSVVSGLRLDPPLPRSVR